MGFLCREGITLKNTNRLLLGLVYLISIITLLNVIIMYWIPIIIPLSSFTAIRLAVLAFIEEAYWLILLDLLICTQLFLTTISIRRQGILLPGLSLLYLIYDFVTVLLLLIDGLHDGYWRTYILQTIILFALTASLGTYCWTYLRNKMFNRN